MRSPDRPIGDFDTDDGDNVEGEVGGEVEVVTVEEDASVGKLNGDDVLGDGDAGVDVKIEGDTEEVVEEITFGKVSGDVVLGDGDVEIEGEVEGRINKNNGDAALGDNDVDVGIEDEG